MRGVETVVGRRVELNDGNVVERLAIQHRRREFENLPRPGRLLVGTQQTAERATRWREWPIEDPALCDQVERHLDRLYFDRPLPESRLRPPLAPSIASGD